MTREFEKDLHVTFENACKYVDGLLSDDDNLAMDNHLAQCKDCTKLIHSVREFDSAWFQIESQHTRRPHFPAVTLTKRLSLLVQRAIFLPRPNRENTFGEWVSSALRYPAGFIIYGLTLGSILMMALVLTVNPNFPPFKVLSFGIQGIAATFVLFVIRFGLQPLSLPEDQRASIATKQFWEFWQVVWILWSLLYFSFSIFEYLQLKEFWVNPILDLLNNLDSVYLYICFLILTDRTVDTVQKQESDPLPGFLPSSGFREKEVVIRERKMNWQVPVVIFLMIFSLEIILQWSSKSHSEESQIISIVFSMMAGVLATVAMAFFVSTSTSKFFSLPRSIVVALFLYFGIQGSFTLILPQGEGIGMLHNWNEGIKIVLVTVAMVGKVLLFMSIHFLTLSDTLFFHLRETAHLERSVKETKDKLFTILQEHNN